MNIDTKDLKNMLRHAYLMGMNTWQEFKDELDTWAIAREDAVDSLLLDQKNNGFTCYNDLHGSCGEDDSVPGIGDS